MPRGIELSTLELVVAKEAIQEYYKRALEKATSYEADEAKGKDNVYNIPLIHPRILVRAAESVSEAIEKALQAEKNFPKWSELKNEK
jgi:hypothetical protein